MVEQERGTCPRCGRDGLRLRQPNRLIPRHKPAGADARPEHVRRDGYCIGSGAWVDEGAPRHAYAGWNNGSI